MSLMYGYVYKTTNLITNKIYIGQHKGQFDKNYFGSGKIIRYSLEKYSKENHVVELIETANSKQDLDKLEKKYIKYYKNLLNRNCLNIAEGGDGGDVWEYASVEEYNKFCLKMKHINSKRCSTDEFKQQCSINMTKRYENQDERLKQSEIVKQSWSNEELRKQQSERLKNFYKDKKRDCSFNHIPYIIEIDNTKLYFSSRKEADNYLSENYNGFTIPRGKNSKLKLDGSNEFYTKNKKYMKLNGMKVYKIIEDVETKSDECSSVR